MGKLTTHVLDLVHGCAGQNIRIDLYQVSNAQRTLIDTFITNHDGRCDGPLLEGISLSKSKYELVFHVGEYFSSMGVKQKTPNFLDDVVIRFGIADENEHYHVPLLLSLYGYSTYRGT